MSELSFEQMLEESFKTIHNGEVVEGTVIDVKPDEIILNIGYKADGIITKSEYSNDQSLDLTTVVRSTLLSLVYSLLVMIPSALYPIFKMISSGLTSITVPSTTSPL